MRANLSFQSRKTMRNAEREHVRRMRSNAWKSTAGRWRSNLALNVFETVHEAVMGEDDFGGNVSGVRFVDNVAAGDFTDEFIRIASPELNIQTVALSINIADADHSVFDFHQKIAIARFPAAGKLQFVAKYDLPVRVDRDFDSETSSGDF